jgi:hypothetical protein
MRDWGYKPPPGEDNLPALMRVASSSRESRERPSRLELVFD